MKKGLNLMAAVIILSLFAVQSAQAQLIDYNRRNRYNNQGQNTTGPATTPRTSAATSQTNSSSTGFQVQNRFERKYDLNRDGKLEGEELTKLFADVVKEVEDDGRSVVMSDILEKYDANGDGYISRYEATRIVQDMKK